MSIGNQGIFSVSDVIVDLEAGSRAIVRGCRIPPLCLRRSETVPKALPTWVCHRALVAEAQEVRSNRRHFRLQHFRAGHALQVSPTW